MEELLKYFVWQSIPASFLNAMIAKIYAKTYRKKEISSKFYNVKGRSYADMILFHDSGYRCFKHFYLEKVCKQLRHLFPKVVSYNRLVELEREVAVPLTLFIKKVLLGKCTGISFVDSTPLRVCKNQRIHIHKSFQRHSPKRQMLHGMVLRLQAASNLQ